MLHRRTLSTFPYLSVLVALIGCASGETLEDSGTDTGAGAEGLGGAAGFGGVGGPSSTTSGTGGSGLEPSSGGSGGTSSCGNDIKDPDEECDGSDVGGITCADLLGPKATGNVTCGPTCAIDAAGCDDMNPCG